MSEWYWKWVATGHVLNTWDSLVETTKWFGKYSEKVPWPFLQYKGDASQRSLRVSYEIPNTVTSFLSEQRHFPGKFNGDLEGALVDLIVVTNLIAVWTYILSAYENSVRAIILSYNENFSCVILWHHNNNNDVWKYWEPDWREGRSIQFLWFVS